MVGNPEVTFDGGCSRRFCADLGAAVTGGVRMALAGAKGDEENKKGRWSIRELR